MLITKVAIPTSVPSTSTESRSQPTPPPEVKTHDESGVEGRALKLAKLFMDTSNRFFRHCPWTKACACA